MLPEYRINCVSATDKAKIYNELITRRYETVLVIAMSRIRSGIQRVISLRKAKNIILFLPESFECHSFRYRKRYRNKTILPYDYINDGKYSAGEIFTAVL